MSFAKYIKEKLIYIILILFGIITSEILLIPFNIIYIVRIYIGIVPIILLFICLLIEYYTKNKFYKTLKDRLNELDEKYLISEIINSPNFIEGKILEECLQDVEKSMLEHVNKYKYLQKDYKEYIELWIHEIKIPIATGKMIIENNKNNVTQSINEELDKIDNYTEQALYYARSNDVEKDYYIKKTSLLEIVNNTILKNKIILRQNNININLQDLNYDVYTDNKWCTFILSQIIQNSIKYSKKDNKEIKIFGESKKEKIILHIVDNGIGIKKGEITRVFDKGFTGTNGRIENKKSTGIGLYLTKKLCEKLGIGIELNSKQDIGTEVKIIFPKNSCTDILNKN